MAGRDPNLKAHPGALPPVGAEGETAAPAAVRRAAAVERAVLTFIDPASMASEVRLAHPFLHQDREIATVVVRRLSLAEVAEVIGSGEAVSLYDFYAAMTGLPVAVLKGMDADDGEAVIETCTPFLPRVAATAFSTPTGANGDAMPSSPAGL